MPDLVDTHCHLADGIFADDLARVLESALGQGVTKIIVPGVDLVSSQRAVKLAQIYPFLYAAVGIHPEAVAEFTEETLVEISSLAAEEKVVAIGEIGLDYHYTQEDYLEQVELFKKMLLIAQAVNKPAIVHSRDAMPDTLEILSEWQSSAGKTSRGSTPTVVLHAFEGNLEQANRAIEMNFALGVGGPITYKNSALKHEVFSKISATHIVLETDSPYLPPQPFRGTRNEPAKLPLVAAYLSKLQDVTIEEIAGITTENADQIFHLGRSN